MSNARRFVAQQVSTRCNAHIPAVGLGTHFGKVARAENRARIIGKKGE